MKVFSKRYVGGFSLIEMMVVLGVVGLLMAFAAPNLFSLITSNSLTGEGTVLRNQFTYAQQIAVSKSSDVEVRFFKYADESAAQLDVRFRAFQLYQFNREGEMVPVSSFFRIKTPVAVHEGMSTLLDPGAKGNDRNDSKYGFIAPRYNGENGELGRAPVGDGGAVVDCNYVAFRFRPDGSTDLPFRTSSSDTWYVTLVQGEGALEDNDPDNYVCLQINSYNGQVSEYRPQAAAN